MANYALVGIPFEAARLDRWRLKVHAANALHRMTLAYRHERGETASGPDSQPNLCQDVRIFRQQSHHCSDGRGSRACFCNSPGSWENPLRQSAPLRADRLDRQIQVAAGSKNADMPRRTQWPLCRCRSQGKHALQPSLQSVPQMPFGRRLTVAGTLQN